MFRHQLFHSSLAAILEPLRPAMMTPEVMRCPDGHFRCVIYGLGPYIADYPEQALLACIVQGWCPKCTAPADDLDSTEAGRRSHVHTDALLNTYSLKILWEDYGIIGNVVPFTARFPWADIHELLCSDLLHQVIKGTFKDHLVTWVGQYLVSVHGSTRAAAIMADIDRRIAAAPPFPGQRHFPEGRGFKQWTGDDSKALMKVYLPAISGHVPPQMVRCLAAFLDINETALEAINVALGQFHMERTNIQLFGAPNGLCSSITESKHIKAVKEPWRRSSHFKALGQMLVTNQRIDKLSASHVDFTSRGLLSNIYLSHLGPSDNALALFSDHNAVQVSGPRILNVVTLAVTREPRYPLQLEALATYLNLPLHSALIRRFLFDQLHPNAPLSGDNVDLNICPTFSSNIHVFHSALATFYAPSDQSGVGGMHHQRIRAAPSWRGSVGRYDCILVEKDSDPNLRGFCGLHAAQHNRKVYPCALVQWFIPIGDHPCEDTGMWMVEPDLDHRGQCVTLIVHLETAVRGVHLLPVYGAAFIMLHAFRAYYINKYADHHIDSRVRLGCCVR
ncbi:hypothetical protein BJV78DRAFT_1277591 [Lactifluus subvellereus]|nr:hypothetical protein BJV78DRAFT_1277591 [Lactifluus subvellereus]